MPVSRYLIAGLIVCSGCASKDEIRVTAANSPTTQRIAPGDVAQALTGLAARIRNQVDNVASRIDDTPEATNAVKRRTLALRLRAVDATMRARSRQNSVIGLFDLWFYTISMEAFVTRGEGAHVEKAYLPMLTETAQMLRTDADALVQRVVPEKQFPILRAQMVEAAGKGELLTTSNEQQQAMLGKVLDATRLESVISIALSPFDAMKGVGSGGEAMSQLVVTANRAVDLAEVYPQLISWQLRMAVVEIEEQDTTRAVREEVRRIGKVVDELPTRLRTEAAALLEQSRPAQETAQKTLQEVAVAATALEKAATATDGVVRGIQALAKSDGPPKPDSRPFDIRDYTTALQAAEATAKQAHAILEAAGSPASKAALDEAVQRIEAAGDRLLWRAGWLLAGTAAAAAGLILLHHRLRRQGDQKR